MISLPNYFLADLPSDTPITPSLVREACWTLKQNRQQHLARRGAGELIATLADICRQWLNSAYPLRQIAIEEGAKTLRLSPQTIAAGLDDFFKSVTEETLEDLCAQDLGHVRRLDGFHAAAFEKRGNRSALARGPQLLTHIGGGVIPNPVLFHMIAGILIRSSQFVKCASGAAVIPRLFAHSIRETEPKLGACLEIAEWKGGNKELEAALFQESDFVTATGSDETLASIRRELPARARFAGYGHRVSFGYIERSALSGAAIGRVARAAAADVAAWDQLGCLSPHLFYVEAGGQFSAEDFAQRLASDLELVEATQPRGPIPVEAAAAISNRRAIYEVRAAASAGCKIWRSENSTAWTVVFEAEPDFQNSCLHRFVFVKPASSLEEALRGAASLQGKVSTIGLAASDDAAPDIARRLADWGAARICPIGKMQSPPLAWRHDGRPALGDLVTWTDWEQ